MAHPNEDLVRGLFAAFGRGDPGALRGQYMAEDACFHYPGRGPLAGDYEGVASVLEMAGRTSGLSGGTYRLELHDVLANDEHAVALFMTRGERAGRRLDDPAVVVFCIRDGTATEMWFYPADLYANDEFWS